MCRCNMTPKGSQDCPIEVSDSEYGLPRVTTPGVIERLVPIEEPVPESGQQEVASDRGRDRGEDHPMIVISGNQGVTRVRPPVSVQ